MTPLFPLMQCSGCRTLFLEPEERRVEEESEVEILPFCPSCGADYESFDEVPIYFEVAWFWEMIDNNFPVTERQILRLQANRGMELPD